MQIRPNHIQMTVKKNISLFEHIRQNKSLYFMVLPGLLFYLIFHYGPMLGLIIAFQDYNIFGGVFESNIIGFKHFEELFQSDAFYRIFRNSLVISSYKLVVCFPIPIIIALMLNEVRHSKFKGLMQTIYYLPYFLSWVVVAGIVKNLLAPADGIVNMILHQFGHEPVHFLARKDMFRTIIVLSDLWHGAGWNTIIFLAALTAVDPILYDAANIDGANRLQQILHVTLPGIKSTIIVMLLLRIGNIMNNGFEQIYLLYNPNVYSVSDVFETYVYRIGLVDLRYDYATAVGLFKSSISFILFLVANRIANSVGEKGIF